MTALVVLSGGQDSTTCLYLAKQQHDVVHAVTFDYNQRHRREIEAARTIAKMAGVASHEVIELGPVLNGASPLTNHDEQLEQYVDNFEMEKTIGDRVELTFVPMRNPLFFTIAANRAACLGVTEIYTGICQADNANYCDCRKQFLDSMNAMVAAALEGAVVPPPMIVAPLLFIPKSDSIKVALQAAGCYTALGYSHTAYDGQYPPLGHDHATTLRAYSFELAGVPDPLIVRASLEGRMDMPASSNYNSIRMRAWLGEPFEALQQLEWELRQLNE